ncbi:MAG: MBOAT family protein [Defluviitaleaceae bacterium]|nr:MBOAT family protein [Defluviitaleaceae bacterium]
MFFTSVNFGLFIACLLIGYYTIFRKFQWQLLLIGSFFFYAFSGFSNLIYISVTICSTWFASRQISRLRLKQKQFVEKNHDLSKEDKKAYKATVNKRQKMWLAFCLLFNFAILAVVKYTDFVIRNTNMITDTGFEPVNFLLPMGISFYTFQTMGYIIDVYRGAEDEPNIFKLGLFTSFFPQLIQGPISRFGDLKKTLFSQHKFSFEVFQSGLARVVWGFFKKLVVADRMMIVLRALVATPGEYTGVYVIFTVLFYAIALYADFTGGIDITIGIARMLGITVKENFNRPFYATSTADYWRRWHITMGTWFKDYLFYPISASRPMLRFFKWSKMILGEKLGKRIPIYVSTMILWFATGLWHGAEWHFIVWGLANGIVIVISEELKPLYAMFHKRFSVGDRVWYHGFQVFRTFWLMSLIRTLDVYANVRHTFRMYWSVLTDFGWDRFLHKGFSGLGIDYVEYIVVSISIFVMITVGFFHYNKKIEFLSLKPDYRCVLITLLVFAIIIFGVYGYGFDSQQFIYNQF